MCTAVTYQTKDFYFGRTLDYDFSYGDEVVVTPRNYPFSFRSIASMPTHYAMIGMAHVEESYPLYYDAINEKGLGIAGLNFVGNADFKEREAGKYNVATYELIPWLLGQCATVKDVKTLLENINITNTAFSQQLPPAQLHWMIADRENCLVLESIKEGIKVYSNPTGVLTNNPPFDEQMFQLNNYMHLSPNPPENLFSDKLHLHTYSRGMGAMGLPGDLSSQSRFVRAAFVRLHAISGESELESVSQFFHILGSVDQQRGCCNIGDGKYEVTLCSTCGNASKGVYYYTTYDNHQITAVDMHRENLNGICPVRYPLVLEEQIRWQN